MPFSPITFNEAVNLQARLLESIGFGLPQARLFDYAYEQWSSHVRFASLVCGGTMPKMEQREGVPFVWCPDFFDRDNLLCATNPCDWHQPFNHFLHNSMPQYSAEVSTFRLVDLAGYPDFSQWLYKNNKSFKSHFFGQKSKSVEWTHTRLSSEERAQVCEFALPRQLDIPGTDPLIFNLNVLYTSKFFDKDEVFVVGYHGSTVVCVMSIARYKDTLVAVDITANKDEKYKPYSLILCAHLYLVKMAFAMGCRKVDLGVNFDAMGDYKDLIPHTKTPMYNFPSIPKI